MNLVEAKRELLTYAEFTIYHTVLSLLFDGIARQKQRYREKCEQLTTFTVSYEKAACNGCGEYGDYGSSVPQRYKQKYPVLSAEI
jgi:hypothetical protein